MLKKILGVLAVIVFGFLITVALQPGEFSLSRSITIAATPSLVFPHVNELRRWESWSPYEKIDLEMKKTYAGPPSGEGASSSWSGNMQVGAGRSTIINSRPNELVAIKLEMFKPMNANNLVEFNFKPEGPNTIVTWTMSGKNNFFGKAIQLFMNMEKMVGPQFEQGLAQLKAVAER